MEVKHEEGTQEKWHEIKLEAVSVSEASNMLGISKGLAYQMIHDGRLRSLRFGKRFRVPKSAIEEALKLPAEEVKKEEPKSAIEKKVIKLISRNKKLREETQKLRQESQKLEQNLALATQSEDFTKLKELHDQAKLIGDWEQQIHLAFGTVMLKLSYGDLQLSIVGLANNYYKRYSIDKAEVHNFKELCAAVDIGVSKQAELADLRSRLLPLEDMIRTAAGILSKEREIKEEI